jgi:hypothetical protein
MYRIDVPEPVERYFLQGLHRWHVEWVEVIGVEDIVISDLVGRDQQSSKMRDRGLCVVRFCCC